MFHVGRGRSRAAENDDCGRHYGWPVADHVERRHRLGSDAAHRGANDRRNDLVHHPDPCRDPSSLWCDQRMEIVGGAAASNPRPRRWRAREVGGPKELSAMGFYQDQIVPLLTSLSMRNGHLAAYRDRVVPAATGRVLEVGVGSGLNLPYYSADVPQVIGLEPSPKLLNMARH